MKTLLLSLLAYTSAKSLRHASKQQRNLSSESLAQTRVIGGQTVSISKYSYAVSLQDNWGHFCGGSLIATDVVLTAAHCLGGDFKAIINRDDIYSISTGDSIDTKRSIPHPSYNSKTTEYDIALVFLKRSTTANVNLVKVNSRPSIPQVGQSVTVMGWGDTIASDDMMELSENLQAVEVKSISNEVCESSSGRINGQWDSYQNQIYDAMLCARDDNQDACQGDSGGPLVVRGNNGDVVVGTVSWGIGCASDIFPGVYARVSSAYDWIVEEVCNGSSDPPRSLCGGNGNGNNGNNNNGNNNNNGATSTWKTLVVEEFNSGYGKFKDGGSDVAYYKSVKGRSGVVRIQAGNGRRSSVFSNQLVLDNQSYAKFKVIFSFYANSMESDDRFCLDYSTNGGTIWKKQKCWVGQTHFKNLQWYDDETVVIKSNQSVDSLTIRFRCDGDTAQDDILIDRVEVQGLEA